MIRKLLFLLAIICATFGCSMSADTTAAEQAVTKFHSMFDAGQFDQIYDESSSVMKSASTKENLVEVLDAAHRELGNVKSTTQTGWNVDYVNGSAHIVLTFKTIYDQGDADERFAFTKLSTDILLSGYHITRTR